MEIAVTMMVMTKVRRASAALNKENTAPTVERVDTHLINLETLIKGMALPILDTDLPSMEVMEGVIMENHRMEGLMEGKVTHLTQTSNSHSYEDTQCLLQIRPGCTHLAFVRQTNTTRVKFMIG